MKRIETFGGALAFAAVAALCWLPWAMLASPFTGGAAALSLYLVLIATAYVALLASGRTCAIRVSITALSLGVAAWIVTHSVSELAVTLAIMIGVLRSGVLFGPAAPRALLVELLLIGGGLTLARLFAAPSAAGVVWGLWSFFLVQSLYLLRGDAEARAEAPADAFETAYRRAMELLSREP